MRRCLTRRFALESDKTSDKDGAIGRVGFEQAKIQQPGFLGHYNALMVSFFTNSMAAHANIAK
jgi:hypothetical protein